MSECNQLLKELVAIPSVNPVYGGPGEHHAQRFVEDWLASRGIDYWLQEVLPGRKNVIARIGSDEKPAVLLEAHMDTVGVDGWATGSPYELVERNGRMFGRGSCDTKASLATFMLLAHRLSLQSQNLKHSLVFAASVDEESQQLGAYAIKELVEDLNLKAAITGEPTRSEAITKHKGACRYTIQATGKAAHGSTPELGENAIYKMARIVEKLERWGELLSRDETLAFIERGSLNVGKIEGGIGFNVVPAWCELDVDRRLGITEPLDGIRPQLESIIESEEGVSLTTCIERPALNTDNANWFPQALLAAGKRVGEPMTTGEVAFMTNGVAYAEAGLPTIVFGPGDIAQAHKTDEYIEAGEMERSLRILEAFFLT